MLLMTFWLNFWGALLVFATLGPRMYGSFLIWRHREGIKADARRRRRITNDATVGWARDEARLLNPVMSAERRPMLVPPPMELTEAEIIALRDWRENSEERQRLLGKDAKRADR